MLCLVQEEGSISVELKDHICDQGWSRGYGRIPVLLLPSLVFQ